VGVDWIQSAQNRVQWRAVVNTAMNLRILQTREFLEHLSDFKFLKRHSAPRSYVM
jgi:hypothetical protein